MKKPWLLFILLLFCAAIKAQSPLDFKVSFHADNLPLKDALLLFAEQSNINLTFSSGLIPTEKRVTVHAEQKQVRTILDQMLAGTDVIYTTTGTQIVLLPHPVRSEARLYTLSGFISDAETGEKVAGAVVYKIAEQTGTYTNEYGYYSLILAEGRTRLLVSYLGYAPDTLTVILGNDRVQDIELGPAFLKEVLVNAVADSILLETRGPNIIRLNIEQIGKLSNLGGEADVLRTAYSLPGIQTGADGFGGIAVRGGNVDQNLFLLDGVPVYNATHGVGVFSIFNSSAIRSAKLLKGNFPAQYGGRISSVWDIQTKEGNSKHFQGEVDIGLSSGKLSLEGPLAKGRGSFFASGRRAFFDFYSVPFTTRLRSKDRVDGYISYFFNDLNLKSNFKLNAKNRIFLSYYQGLDDFRDVYEQSRLFQDTAVFLKDNEVVTWGNRVAALRWNHQYSAKVFGNTTLTYSKYFYESKDLVDLKTVRSKEQLLRNVLLLKYNSNVEDLMLKSDFDVSALERHRIRFGASAIRHQFQPGIISFDQATAIDSIIIDTLGEWNKVPLESYEFDGYIQDEVRLTPYLDANIGFRASALSVDGVILFSPQPRILLNFLGNRKLSFHASAARVTQFLHLLSPTSIGLPKDLWVSATRKIPPQHSWQFSTGLTHRIASGIELDFEGYYKSMKNLLIFKGTVLDEVNSSNWQDVVSTGKGEAYGLEVLLKKQTGKLLGWLGYTLAWTDRQFDKEINKGEVFPFRLDHRNSLDVQLLYKLNKKWEFALGFKYASGSAFTFPSQEYELVQPPGSPPTEILPRPGVIERLNGERLPAYHKLDFSFNRYFIRKNGVHTIVFGFYNTYNRKNPLYITLRDKFQSNGEIKREIVQVSLLPLFPTLRYKFEFK
jgi:carboxypeptidase-like protein/TonB-dependent receptor-like protein